MTGAPSSIVIALLTQPMLADDMIWIATIAPAPHGLCRGMRALRMRNVQCLSHHTIHDTNVLSLETMGACAPDRDAS